MTFREGDAPFNIGIRSRSTVLMLMEMCLQRAGWALTLYYEQLKVALTVPIFLVSLS